MFYKKMKDVHSLVRKKFRKNIELLFYKLKINIKDTFRYGNFNK